MFLAVVDGGLESLKRCLVNPLQALALVLGHTRAGHQKPPCGKLCLGITAVGSQFVPKGALRKVFLYAIAIPRLTFTPVPRS